MPQPIDRELYKNVRDEAYQRFEKPTPFKYIWIAREYKKRGGRYATSKVGFEPSKKSTIVRIKNLN